MMNLNRVRFAALMVSACALMTLHSHAQDAAPAPVKLAMVGRMALAPAAQIQAVADDLGITLPAMFTPAGVEQMFTFLGAGGFNKDLPSAIDVQAGSGDLTWSQRVIAYVPVNADHALLKDFLAGGEKMGDDGAIVAGSPFRRTGDYLLFGGTPETIGAVKPDAMVGSLSDHPLFYLEYNAKKLREVEPAALVQFKQSIIENGDKPQTKSEEAGQMLAINAMVDGLEKLVVRLDKKPDAFRLMTGIQPAPEMASKKWDLPGMPDGLAGRFDVQMPPSWVRGKMEWFRQVSGDEEFFKDVPADTPEKKKQFVNAISDMLETAFMGDEASYGVGLNDGDLVVYIITQSNAPRGGHDDWKRAVDGLQPFIKEDGKKDDVTLSQFTTAAGEQADRMICLGDDGKQDAVVESIDRNGVRFTTITDTKNNTLESLLASKGNASLSQAAAGWVDLHALMELVNKADPSMPKLADADRQLLDKVLSGQRINWSVSAGQNQLDLSLDLPVTLVKNVIANASDLVEFSSRMSDKVQNK